MPVFSKRNSQIKTATSTGSNDKFAPGTYIVEIDRGVYVVSASHEGATYFGIETTVKRVLLGNTKEENDPYPPSQRENQAASWVFNITPNKRNQYLADANVKNIAEAIIDAEGFEAALGDRLDEFTTIFEAFDRNNSLDPSFCEAHGLVDDEGPIVEPAPYAWVADRLIEEGGDYFHGLLIHVKARDARSKKNPGARPFVACDCRGATQADLTAAA